MRSLLAVIVLAAAAAPASAGTYIGLGIGTGPSIGNDTIPNANNDGRSGRFILGMKFGRLSVEGEANRFGMLLNGDSYDSTMLGLGLKYSLPLANGFELFGRGGLQRTWLSSNADRNDYEGSGNGYFLGAGVEYRIRPFGSVFVDYERQSATIDGNSTPYGQSAGMFTLGATIDL
jgi:hypothetical protein